MLPFTTYGRRMRTRRETPSSNQFLTTTRKSCALLAHLFDQDPQPISICQVFIDGLDSCLIAGFCSHFSNYSMSQALTATHQCKTLEAMMQAMVKAKTEYTNIRTIASKAMGGTPGQAFQAQVCVSQAERILTQYGTGDEGFNSTGG
jgi:hypothetical protein